MTTLPASIPSPMIGQTREQENPTRGREVGAVFMAIGKSFNSVPSGRSRNEGRPHQPRIEKL